MVFTCPLISKFSSPFTNLFGGFSKCINYNWYHRHLYVHSIFSSLARAIYIYIYIYISSHFLLLCGLLGQQSPLFGWFSFFFLFFFVNYHWVWSFGWSVCISKFQRRLCVLFSWTDSELCISHLFVKIAHRIVFLPIFVFWLLSFCWLSCFYMLSLSRYIDASTLSSKLASPLSPFLFLFSQRHLKDVMPYAWSLVFLISRPFV